MLPLTRDYFFFFNDTATTEIYTLSLHDALPIYLWLLHLEPCFHLALQVTNTDRDLLNAAGRFVALVQEPEDLIALFVIRSEEHTSELQSQSNLVCRLLLEKKNPHARRWHYRDSR